MIAEYPTREIVATVCKIGQGNDCCRYLTIGGGGWSCEKHAPLRAVIDLRVASGNMTAQGDNCEGRMSR